jgi:organic hydroperoxide reductase OsmC/OhrA
MSEVFQANVVWPSDSAQKTPPDASYSRSSWLSAPGKGEVPGSSGLAFGGDPHGYNPEELLILSLAECHMLTFLGLAARRKLGVKRYGDKATGTLTKNAAGRTQMAEVILHPHVVFANGTDLEEVQGLHTKAHELCFMANSMNFPVRVEPVSESA